MVTDLGGGYLWQVWKVCAEHLAFGALLRSLPFLNSLFNLEKRDDVIRLGFITPMLV